ncbi:MAG: SH3 domain-containing protein [Bacteroidota bacterium]
MKRLTLLALFGFLFGTLTLAQSAEEVVEQANQQLGAQRYEQAIASYESLISQGYSSASLHFNLGMAHYHAAALGPAILHLEKARKLAPYDGKIEKNLELIRNEQKDGLLPLPTFFLYDWWHNIAARLRPDAWAVLAVIFMILGALGVASWFRYRKAANAPAWFARWRRRLLLTAPILLVFALLFVLFATTRTTALAKKDQAVLLRAEVIVYATPDEKSNQDITLHEGLRVRLLDTYEGWKKIELVDGRSGWVKSDQLAEI